MGFHCAAWWRDVVGDPRFRGDDTSVCFRGDDTSVCFRGDYGSICFRGDGRSMGRKHRCFRRDSIDQTQRLSSPRKRGTRPVAPHQ
jgi:hypothetical protein